MTDELIKAATLLGNSPEASTSEIAKAMGISRATLHRRYGTREQLERAIGDFALLRLGEVLKNAAIHEAPTLHTLSQLVVDCVGMAPLYRTLCTSRDPQIALQWAKTRHGLLTLIENARRDGVIRVDMPAKWLAASLDALICTVTGNLFSDSEPSQAALMVWQTFMHGAAS